LNQNDKTEDEAERTRSLKACHQRCADRTLKVLEKNGSIFIKLGQHLVRGAISSLRSWSNTLIERDELPVTSRMDNDFYTATR
jgi:aarF domain-containing kinase